MNKYIDADTLKGFMFTSITPSDLWDKEKIDAFVDRLPSADVQEVKHGRWIKKYRGNYLCSVCGAWYRTTDDYGNIIDGEMKSNYCEFCGAKMDL